MLSTKPTILFVHGSWHTPKHFQRVRDLFQEHGYTTSCPLLPSAGSLPPVGLMEDAECIRSELEQLINVESKDVIVIAHSYGGMVASQAIDKDFGKKEREANGRSGGMVRIIYVCAFIVLKGDSLGSALGGGPPPDTKLPPFIPVAVCLICFNSIKEFSWS
jgi:pimeloyl-ACP methyl ester carboxylesterase